MTDRADPQTDREWARLIAAQYESDDIDAIEEGVARGRTLASGTPTRRAETLGSVGEADGGPTLEEGDAHD